MVRNHMVGHQVVVGLFARYFHLVPVYGYDRSVDLSGVGAVGVVVDSAV